MIPQREAPALLVHTSVAGVRRTSVCRVDGGVFTVFRRDVAPRQVAPEDVISVLLDDVGATGDGSPPPPHPDDGSADAHPIELTVAGQADGSVLPLLVARGRAGHWRADAPGGTERHLDHGELRTMLAACLTPLVESRSNREVREVKSS